MPHLLLDNDVVLKLAQYDILNEFAGVFGEPTNSFILPTLRYRFSLNDDTKAMRIVRDGAALERLRAFVASASELVDEPDATLLSVLDDLPAVDVGEAILFAIASSDSHCLVFTGDKRSVVALAGSESTRGIVRSLAGRVHCLEQVVARILDSHQEALVQKIQGRVWDQSLQICFGCGTVQGALRGLGSYYRNLRETTGDLLAPFPIAT
jgi:hypothetical protein